MSEAVDRLILTPPKVRLSFWQKIERGVAYLAIALAVVAITLGGVAIDRVGAQGTCTNNVLGQRQKANDTPAVIEMADGVSAWAQGLVALFALPKHQTAAEKKQESDTFIHSTQKFAKSLADASRTLEANQAYREAHPLGEC